MKTGENIIDKNISENNKDIVENDDKLKNEDDITVIIKRSKKRTTPVIISLLPLLAMLIAILPSVIYRTTDIETARTGIITLLLTGAAVFYIRFNAEGILGKKLSKTIIILGYLASISLLLFVPQPEIFSFWMIGGLLVSMLLDNKLGLLLHFNLAFIMGIALNVNPESVIQVLMIGALMNLLAGSLRQKASFIYAAIIILSTNITISFAINNFIFETQNNFNYLNSLYSIFAVLITAFTICLLYPKTEEIALQNTEEKDVIEGESMETVKQEFDMELSVQEVKTQVDISDAQITGARTSFEVLSDLDNDLIMKMKQHSEVLYAHALRIGDLSYRAAIEIGANEMLALVGGLYHEIGKIRGKNYIEEGLIIAEDYAFPKELKAILREHNIKYDKPSSVEAAIVMLSDSVQSTVEYIEKNDEHKYGTEKIIENIFQMRMDKGTFDNSTLSLKDYKKLKEFFQKEFV